MHLLSTRPGGHVEDDGQGVVRVEQTPGDIVVLTVADTTLSLLAEVAGSLPDDFPSVRLANLMWLRQPASIDMYMDDVLRHAKAIVIEHLGSPSDWAYIVDQVCASAQARGQWLVMVSGECVEDAQLLIRSTASKDDCRDRKSVV